MTENHFDEDDLFESRRDDKNEYSTFIEELEESTEKLMNEVFHSEYVPQINPQDINLHELDFSKSSRQSTLKSFNSKLNFTSTDFNKSKRTAATRCTQREKEPSESFVNFLIRNEKWKERRLMRAENEHNRKEEEELKKLTFIPSILQRSREKIIEPIYERCLDLQKEKETKIAMKRIEKEREEDKKESQYSFQPQIITKSKNRTLEEYLKDKEDWKEKRMEYIENEKLWQETKKTEECIFRPILIPNKYNTKFNSQKEIQEKVEDRLMKSLEKSLEKKEQIKKSTIVPKFKNKK